MEGNPDLRGFTSVGGGGNNKSVEQVGPACQQFQSTSLKIKETALGRGFEINVSPLECTRFLKASKVLSKKNNHHLIFPYYL